MVGQTAHIAGQTMLQERPSSFALILYIHVHTRYLVEVIVDIHVVVTVCSFICQVASMKNGTWYCSERQQ